MVLHDQIKEWVIPTIKEEGHDIPQKDAIDASNMVVDYLVKFSGNLIEHLIHRDAHPENILFKDNKLSGIIDFDIVVIGPRIFDPCYCSSSIFTSSRGTIAATSFP